MRPLILERRPALSTLTTAAAAGGFRLQLDSEEDVRLVAESVELFLNFAELTRQSRYDPDVRQQGYLWVTTEEPRAEAQRAIVASQRGWGVPNVELLSGDDARRAFPFLGPEVRQARFRAADGLLDPKRLTMGLAAGSGALVMTECSVRGFRVLGDRLAAVETDAGAVATRAAVIAAGPFSGALAARAGVALPISTVVRQKVVLPDVPQVPASAPMTIDDDSGAHWRPALRGASLLFTDPEVPPSPPTEDVPLDQEFAFRLLDPGSPVSVARVTPFWGDVWEWGGVSWLLQAGQYTMTPDRRPLIGPTGVEGLYVNTGYSGKGVMGGPAGSRHVVDVLLARIKAHENPFRLDRSLGERPHVDPL